MDDSQPEDLRACVAQLEARLRAAEAELRQWQELARELFAEQPKCEHRDPQPDGALRWCSSVGTRCFVDEYRCDAHRLREHEREPHRREFAPLWHAPLLRRAEALLGPPLPGVGPDGVTRRGR